MMGAAGLPLSGRLEDAPVTALLHAIHDENLSGCISVTRGKAVRRLYVKDGMITYGTSTERQDRLGEILIAQGSLTPAEVEEAFVRARKSKYRLGRYLLVEGKISSQELFLGVTAQIVNILERMRGWRKGGYSFAEGEEPEAGTVLLRIPLSLYLHRRDRSRRRTEAAPMGKPPGEAPESGSSPETPPETAPPPASEEEELIVIEEDDVDAAEAGPGEGPQGDEGGDGGEEFEKADGEIPAEEREKRVQEISFTVQELKLRRGRGPRALLGLKPSSSLEAVREAYDYLVALLDSSIPAEGLDPEVADEARQLFDEVVAAYGTIASGLESEQDSEDEAEQEASPAAPPAAGVRTPGGRGGRVLAAVDPGDVTRGLFYRAKQYMAKGNYWQAADAMRDVVRRKPGDAMYRNLLGICLMQTGRRLHEAEEHVKEAIRLDPGNPDFVTSLGLVYKAGRFNSKARDMFKQALLYDKRHVQAREELRKLGNVVDSSPRKSAPLWSKLFGK